MMKGIVVVPMVSVVVVVMVVGDVVTAIPIKVVVTGAVVVVAETIDVDSSVFMLTLIFWISRGCPLNVNTVKDCWMVAAS